jgi:hypothetical protein
MKMKVLSQVLSFACLVSMLVSTALAQDTGKKPSDLPPAGVCEPEITIAVWGGLIVVTLLVFGIGKFVVTPMLVNRAAEKNPENPAPAMKSAEMKGMGFTAILTAITLLVVSLLLLGCIPTPMMIFIALVFVVIFTYGLLFIK